MLKRLNFGFVDEGTTLLKFGYATFIVVLMRLT